MQTDSVTLPQWKDPKKMGLAVFAAFVFQILILSALTAKGLVPRFASTRIRLEVADLQKTSWRDNNHFHIYFAVSTLPKEQAQEMDAKPKTSDTSIRTDPATPVFVHLKFLPEENLWVPVKFGPHPPREGKFLKGRLFPSSRGRLGYIEFGIEDFYFREGNGIDYQNALEARKLAAEIYLAPNGSCQMKSLVFLDKPLPHRPIPNPPIK